MTFTSLFPARYQAALRYGAMISLDGRWIRVRRVDRINHRIAGWCHSVTVEYV